LPKSQEDELKITPGLSNDAIRQRAALYFFPMLACAAIVTILVASSQKTLPTGLAFVWAFLVVTLLYFALPFILIGPARRHIWHMLKARRWGLGVWRVSPFARIGMRNDGITKVASGLETEDLLGAYHWPDHGGPARTAIKQELVSRGLAEEQIDRWRPPPERLHVPSVASVEARERSIEATAQSAVFALGRLVAIVALAALVGVVVLTLVHFIWYQGRISFQTYSLLSMRNSFLVVAVIGWALLVLIIIPIGVLLGLKKTIRILLLRPFGERKMTKALKQVVIDHLGTRAHVFTLSDRNYRPNPFVRLGDFIASGVRYLIAAVARPSIRIATVKNARTYLRMATKLSARLQPSFRNFVTGGQASNIKSTDRWWKWCIDLLMHSCDVIVMDISKVSTGSTWEIDQLLARGKIPMTVFIAQEAHEEHGLEALRRVFPANELPRIFLYDATGKFRDPDEFDAELKNRIRHGLRIASEAARSEPVVATA
jgi:hypothetical protein